MNAGSPVASPLGPSLNVLRIEEIFKDFGYKKVLNGVNFQLSCHEVTLLLGRNGAGKSTLMKIISGLVRPNSGRIIFYGEDIAENPTRFRKSIGVISHATQFYGELTARENLLFFAKLHKIMKPSEKIVDALKRTDLLEAIDVPVKNFSSGMNKRLNIARLMVIEPEILLLDEPYTGLDYDSIGFFNHYMTEFKNKGGAILLISHQIDICFDLCDKVAILHKGKIQKYEQTAAFSCSDLIREYQNIG